MREKKINSFKELRVWQHGIELTKDVYKLTKNFPKEEIYGLTSQIRRAAASIPSNIAEGFRRFHGKEFNQFLRISLGSLAEVETQLIISHSQSYLTAIELEQLSEKLDRLGRMINVLIARSR